MLEVSKMTIQFKTEQLWLFSQSTGFYFFFYMDALFSAQVEVIMINLHNSSIGLFSSHWMKWFENGDVTYRVHQSELAIGIYQQL